MGTMIVLGYRQGMARALARRGLEPFWILSRHKKAVEGQRYRLVDSLRDTQAVLRAVLGADVSDVVGAVTAHEEGVFSTALLRDHLGLPGDRSYGNTLYFRDKFLQKTALSDGVSRAKCRYVGPHTTFVELAEELGVPFVVKPADGRGSVSTGVVGSDTELRALTGPSLRSEIGFVAESFVRGDEIHVDGVWIDGRLRWSSVGSYSVPMMRSNTGSVLADQVLARDQNEELFVRAERLAVECLESLPTPDCVFHLEAFADGLNLTFGECAIRVPGAHIPEITEHTYGVNLFEVQASLALGEPVDEVLRPRVPEEYFGYVYLRRFPGRNLTQQDFERRFSLVEIDYPADSPAAAGPYGRAGHAILADPDCTRLRERLSTIARFNSHG